LTLSHNPVTFVSLDYPSSPIFVFFCSSYVSKSPQADELKLSVREVTERYNSKFNPQWGQRFKAGHEDSRFAKQVTDY
jgi:hypothetical protein